MNAKKALEKEALEYCENCEMAIFILCCFYCNIPLRMK